MTKELYEKAIGSSNIDKMLYFFTKLNMTGNQFLSFTSKLSYVHPMLVKSKNDDSIKKVTAMKPWKNSFIKEL